jgi:hypothetical protein
MQFDDIGIMQLVIPLDCLAVKNTLAPDAGEFQRVLELPVLLIVKILYAVHDFTTDFVARC